MAIIPVLGVTAAIFSAIVAAVIGGFVFGVIFIFNPLLFSAYC